MSGKGEKVTDAGLLHLKDLAKLETLHLTTTHISNAGLAHLKGLSNLRGLGLANTDVTNAGLVHLKALVGDAEPDAVSELRGVICFGPLFPRERPLLWRAP